MQDRIKKLNIIKQSVKGYSNYRRKKIKLDNFPTVLWVEPTNACNLKCVMCPNPMIPKNDLGYMKWDIYTKIIDEAKDFVSSIYFLIAGESTLHKEVYNMMKYSRENGIRPLLNTNGTTFNSEKNRNLLLDSGIAHLTIAFDGYNKETYEKIRVGANFERVVNGTIDLLKEKKRRKQSEPYIAITTLALGMDNYKDKVEAENEFKSYFEGLDVDEFIVKTPNTWGSTFEGTEEWAHHHLNVDNYHPCSHLWSTLSIMWDGTVVPCCFDFFKTYVVGDINKKSIKEIWNDRPMLELRKSMVEGKSINPLCENCVILHLEPVLGVPAGMRTAMKDTITNLVGMKTEKRLLKIAKKLTPTISLDVQN